MTDFLNLTGGNEDNGVGSGTDGGGLVFDLSDVKEDTGFEILPKGNYNAIVDELEFGDSSKGNAMITAKFKITDGEAEGRVVFDYWVLNGKGAEFGLGKLKKFLTRVMPEVDMTAFNPEVFAEEATAIGRELTLVLGVQKQTKGEYKGESRNTVRDILAPSEAAFI
jgi:hypothetical protein